MKEDITIENLKSRDVKAFNALFFELFHHVRRYAERIVKDENEAEDIASHSFSKYWELAANFNSINEIKSFLYTTAKNKCFDYFDKLKAQENYKIQHAYLSSQALQQAADRFDYEALMLEELYSEVIKEVEKLPKQTREVFKMVYFENMSRADVAEKLKISVGTVHVHCSTAIKKLKSVFSEQDLILILLLLFGYSKD